MRNSVTFQFTDIQRPEGLLRIKMWRAHTEDELEQAQHDPKRLIFATVNVSSDIITKYPVWKRKLERLFNQATVENFDLEIYDTPLAAHLLSNPFKYDIGLETRKHLFTRYICPDRSTQLFCTVSWKEDGESEFTDLVTGIAQPAIESDDLQVWHDGPSPFLNDTTNKEYHVERIWKVRFIPTTLAGLGSCPADPRGQYRADEEGNLVLEVPGYGMTFFSQANQVYPWDVSVTESDPTPATIAQVAGSFTYTDTNAQNRHAIWRRHINARKWLVSVFDFVYGTDNWIFECDDSPFEFHIADLQGDGSSYSESYITQPGGDSYTRCTHNAASQAPSRWMLLPQWLFGFGDDLEVAAPVPRLESHLAQEKNVWEAIHSYCFMMGWVPIVEIDRDTKKHKVRFVKREEVTNSFTTIVPTQSSASVLEESEEGIECAAPQFFMDAIDSLGWNDDWFAKRQDESPSYVWGPLYNLNNAVVTKPMRNPYTVPATAKSPAGIYTCMNMGGIATGPVWQGYSNVFWYSLGYPLFDTTPGIPHDPLLQTEDFPTVTPLMTTAEVVNDTVVDGLGLVLDEPLTQSLTGADRCVMFFPVVKGKFRYTTSDGTVRTIICKSWRQLLARYYAQHFVRSDSRYKRTYSTISQFTCSTPGNEFGKRSWKYIDLLYKTQLPVIYGGGASNTETHYVRGIERDFNTMDTSVEYNAQTPLAGTFDNGFLDLIEDTGTGIGLPPNDPPPPKDGR